MTRPLIPRLPKPWRPRPLLPLLTLAVLAVGIAASAGAGLRTGPRGEDVRATPVAAAGHAVQIVNFAFAPQSLTVAQGDSITWTNQDEAPHTVTTTSGPRQISSPMLSKGQSFTFTFTVAGTYSYYCAVHPDMRAQVVVTPAPAPSTKPSTPAKPSASAPPSPTHTAALHSTQPSVAGSADSGHGSMTSAPSAPSAQPKSSAASGTSASSATPAPSNVPTSGPPPSTDEAAAVPSAANSGQDPLNPTLLLAGLTAGATVFCLLLAASRRSDES